MNVLLPQNALQARLLIIFCYFQQGLNEEFLIYYFFGQVSAKKKMKLIKKISIFTINNFN